MEVTAAARRAVSRTRFIAIPLLGRVILGMLSRERWRAESKDAVYSSPEVFPDEFVDYDIEVLKTRGAAKALVSMLLGVVEHPVTFYDRLQELRIPTLLIHGKQDKLIPVSDSEAALMKIASAKLHILEECGHAPHIEKPKEFNRLVTTFLKSN